MKTIFAKNQWDIQDWMFVKYPGIEHEDSWIQEENCIVNATPTGIDPQDMRGNGKYINKTFVGMILREEFNSPMRISYTMSFDHRMAPLIHITNEVNINEIVPCLGQRYKVVLHNEGVNIWEHYLENGNIKYRKKLFHQTQLDAKKTQSCVGS